MTWGILETITGNKIDHLLINRNNEKDIKDWRLYRSANAGSDSVIVKPNLRIVNIKKKVRYRRRNARNLGWKKYNTKVT